MYPFEKDKLTEKAGMVSWLAFVIAIRKNDVGAPSSCQRREKGRWDVLFLNGVHESEQKAEGDRLHADF